MADSDNESEIMTAITAFEQILEAIPNDRASLEALSHAYEQIGDLTRARDFLIRLGEVMLDEDDIVSARGLLSRLEQFADEDPRAKDLAEKIGSKGASADESAANTVAAKPMPVEETPEEIPEFNMADELSFAWNLMEANQLTQEEYSKVVQDLTEMSAGEGTSTISVLHVLDAMSFKGIEKVLSYIADKGNAPIVSLTGFDLRLDTVECLPFSFMQSRGVLAYDFLASDALVVVMNPFDKQLLKDVEKLAKRQCHFYTCLPVEFDKALEKATEILAVAAEHRAEQEAAHGK